MITAVLVCHTWRDDTIRSGERHGAVVYAYLQALWMKTCGQGLFWVRRSFDEVSHGV